MILAMSSAMDSNLFDSPFVVPVAGCVMALGIAVAGIFSGIRQREMQSQERLAAIAKGLPLPPTLEELAIMHGKPSVDTTRRRGSTRRAGIVLLGCAAGLILFFIALAAVLTNRYVLCGAAAGLIPFGVGIGLLVDAKIQSREIDEATTGASPSGPGSLRSID